MLKPVHLRLFEKEVSTAKKRGKDINKLKEMMRLLTFEEPLPPKAVIISRRAIMLAKGNVILSLTGY